MASKFTITAELNLQTKNLNQVVNNLRQQFQGANLNIKLTNLAQANSQMVNLSKNSAAAKKSVDSLGGSVLAAAKRFSGMALATGTLIGLTRAIKNAVGEAIEFEREMVKISQATGKTMSDLKSLSSEIGNVASNFGVSSKELVLAARELTQAGFAADKVRGTLKLLAQTELAATFDSIQDTTEGVIAVLNQFGKTAQRAGTEIDFLEKSLSAINQVSKDFAVESADLITAIRTTGSAFESAGGSLDELLALFTSVRATTRESAESIATGFRTIFTRTQRLDTINNLRALGIELQDAEGKFIGPVKAIEKLSLALNTIDPKDFRFNLIVEELGGFRQVSKVIPLIQQFSVAQKALNVSQTASGSLAKDAATAQQSLSVQIDKTREEFKRFIRELTDSKSFQDTARFLLSLANAFIKVADTIKPLIPLIATFATFKLGQAFIPAIKGLGSIGKKSLGGPIGFASGGMVPGQGNGDTVPAMLTPGEFVIRKSSVEKLGAENLARMNKYAAGGRVTIFPKSNKYGVFALQPLGAKDDILRGKAKVKNKSVEAQLAAMAKKPDASVEIAADDTYQVPAFYIGGNDAEKSQAMKKRIEKVTKAGFKKIISTIIETPDFDLGSPPLKTDQSYFNSAIKSLFEKDNSAKATIEGYVLEAVTASLGQVKLGGGTSNWDFPSLGGKGEKLSQLFGLDKAGLISSLISGDAKRSISDKAIRSVLGTKIANSLLQDRSQIGLTKYDQTGVGVKIESSKAVAKKQQAQVKQSSLKGMQAQSEEFRKKIVEIAGEYFNFAKDPNTGLQASRLNLQNFGAGATDLVKGILGPDMKGKFGKNDFSLSEAEQKKVLDQLKKWQGSPPVSLLKSALGGIVSRFAEGGGVKNAPLVDDILQATGAILPHPVKAIQAIIDAGGGAVDMDRTLKRTIGDQAYAKAPTKKAQAEVLKRYFRDDAARLADVKSAPLTQFGKALKDAVESGQINPRKMQIISKSGRTPGLAEYLSSVFGIPVSNMVFTEGKTKQPALDALRQKGPRADRVSRFASGGFASGTDTVPAMLTPGEFVINKQSAQKIGYSNLHRMNKVAKFANGGAVGVQHLAIGGEVDQQSHYKPNNKESLDSVLSKHRDDELQSNFIKTANLSPNFAESLSKYRELGLIQKSNSKDRNSSTKSFIAAYGLSKLKDEDLKNKFKDKFEINDEIKNIFKYYDSGISDLVSYLGKQDKIKLSQITGHDFSKNKNYGNIEIFSGKNDILARYVDGENDRTGFVEAKKNKDNFYRVKFSYATSGYGPKLYDALLEEAAKIGSWVAPDTNISKNAAGVWKNYYLNRQDVNKKLMDYNNWNNASGKFQTKPEKDIEKLKLTWPKKEDPDWALQYAYQKPSSDNKNIIRAKKKFGPSYEGREAVLASIKNFATGGKTSGTDTVPAMLTPGEFVINKQSAQAIGYSSLNRMNKVGKFAKGGPVKYFAQGGSVSPNSDAEITKFINSLKVANSVTAQGAKILEKTLKSVAANNGDLDKSFEYLKNRIDKAGGAIMVGKKTVAGVKEAAGETSQQKQIKELENLNQSYESINKASSESSNNLILLGAVVSSVVSQMSGLDKPIADAISAFAGTYATVSGIGKNLLDFGKNIYIQSQQSKIAKQIESLHTFAVQKDTSATTQHSVAVKTNSKMAGGGGGIPNIPSPAGKGMSPLGGGLGGMSKMLSGASVALEVFAVAMAAADAAAAYFAASAEKSGEKFSKSLEELTKYGSRSTVSSADMSKNLSDAFSSSAISNSISEIFSFKTLGNALTGNLDKQIMGAYTAKSSGAVIGAQAYENVLAQKSGQTLLEKPELFKDKEVIAKTEDLTNAFSKSSIALQQEKAKIAKVYGGFENAPEQVKKGFEVLANQTDELEKTFRQASGILSQRVIKELQTNADANKAGDNRGVIDRAVRENLGREQKIARAKNEENFQKVAALGNNPNRKFAQMDLDRKVQAEAKLANAEFALSIEKANLQMMEQTRAIMVEKQAREAVIGSMQKQMALAAGLENFAAKLDKINSSVDTLEATFSGTITGLKSSIPDTKVLTAIAPDTKDLKAALDAISSIGPEGKEVADSFLDVKKVTQNLKIALSEAPASLTQVGKAFSVETFIEKNIGISSKGSVGKALADMINQQMKPTEGENVTGAQKTSLSSKEAQENILKNFQEFADYLQKEGSTILENLAKAEEQQAGILQKISESRKRQLDIVMQDIDGQEKLADNVAKARGKTLTLEEKNAFRYKKQFTLVGNLAGNAQGIAAELDSVRKALKTSSKSDEGTQKLAERANNLETALKSLADQSDRTSDVMSELEKLRSQRELARDATASYLFGTKEEKDKQEETMMALQGAMQTGNIESIPDELKSGVLGLLQQFKDVKAFGGMTGREVQNKLMANKMMEMGNVEGAMAIANDTSSQEEKLIQELGKINNQEIASRQGLLAQEGAMQAALQEALKNSKDATVGLAGEIAQLRIKFEEQRNAAGLGAPKPQEIAAVDKDIEAGKKKVEELSNQIKNGEVEVAALGKKFIDHINLINETANFDKASQSAMWLTDALFNMIGPLDSLAAIAKEFTGFDIKNTIAKGMDLAAFSGGIETKSTGGLIYRAGGGFAPRGTDTVPAMLTPGEFVVNKRAVDKFGAGNLQKINAGYYANGGQVDPLDPYYKMLADIKRGKQKRQEQEQALIGDTSLSRAIESRNRRRNMMRGGTVNLMAGQATQQASPATPVQQAGTAPKAPVAAGGGLPDMTGFAQSVESLNSIAATFSSFTETLASLANQFAGITVQHTMTVDGNIALTGVNGPEIAKQLSDAIIGQIRTEVLNQIQLNNRQEKR
jgi:hypothetical protein